MTYYTSRQIFTGDQMLDNFAVLVSGEVIQALVPIGEVAENADVKEMGDVLAPAFIDLQIYGAHNNLLAVQPSAETLQKMYDYCYAGGAPLFQPTVATNTYPVIYQCIDAVRSYWQAGGKGVYGLHIEGPWLSKEKRGAHVESFIHAPTLQQVQEVLEYGEGVITMITLAPEICSPQIVEFIQSHGVLVSAGHSNATYKQALDAFNNGIALATHLFNAMSPLQHREPGMVGAIMQSKAMCSIVADGFHVDFAAISIAKKVMGERLFFITDAVTETKEGHYLHTFGENRYTSNGILSGSALTMAACVRNAVAHCEISLAEALKMASLYPARAINQHHKLGKLAPGYQAKMVALNDDLNVVGLV